MPLVLRPPLNARIRSRLFRASLQPASSSAVAFASGLASTLFFGACAPPNAALPYPSAEPKEGESELAEEESTGDRVRFLDREISLAPFLKGFPTGSSLPTWSMGCFFSSRWASAIA